MRARLAAITIDMPDLMVCVDGIAVMWNTRRARVRLNRGVIGGIVAATLAGSLAACSSGTGGSGAFAGNGVDSGGGSSSTIIPGDQAEQRYGQGPTKNSHISYQPDVVLIGGGPHAIRSASSDGLVWTMNGNAPGVKDLQPGKIMFASREAVGRVVAIKHVGSDVAVSLLPVQITDVIRNGTLAMSKPFDLSSAAVQEVPDAPGAFTVPSSTGGGTSSPSTAPSPNNGPSTGESASPATPTPTTASTIDYSLPDNDSTASDFDAIEAGSPSKYLQREAASTVSVPDVHLASNGTSDDKFPLPVSLANGIKLTVGQWEFKMSVSKANTLSVQALYDTGNAKFGITFDLVFNHPRVDMSIPVANGSVQGTPMYGLSGLRRIDAHWSFAGQKTDKFRVELPLDVADGFVDVYGVPLAYTIKFKLLMSFGFAAKKSAASGRAAYVFEGNEPVGYGHGTAPLKPSTDDSLGDTIADAALAPWAFVVGSEVKGIAGLGVPQFMAGAYVKVFQSLGFAGSGPGDLVPGGCHQVTYVLGWAAGVGTNVSGSGLDDLITKLGGGSNPVIAKFRSKLEVEDQILGNDKAINKTMWYPHTKGCEAS